MFKQLEISKFYFELINNRRNLIILGALIIVIGLASYMSLNLGFDEGYFEFIYTDYLTSYFISVLRMILIVNSIIIPIVLLSDSKIDNLTINTILFRKIGSSRLFISKMCAYIVFGLYLCIIEYIIIMIMPLIFYPYFKLNFSFISLFIYINLFSLLIILFSYLIQLAIKSIFVAAIPVILVFMSFMLENEYISYIVLDYKYNYDFSYLIKNIIVLVCIDFIFLTIDLLLNRLAIE